MFYFPSSNLTQATLEHVVSLKIVIALADLDIRKLGIEMFCWLGDQAGGDQSKWPQRTVQLQRLTLHPCAAEAFFRVATENAQ